MRNVVVVGVVLVGAAASASCQYGAVECGEGTMLVNGACEIAIAVPLECRGMCGLNTVYDPTLQRCVGEASVVCDPDTTSEVTDEITGITTCRGEAGCGPIACPNAEPGKVNVCGQLVDIETSARLDMGDGGLCDADNPSGVGPCSLALDFYDALAFAQNPSGTRPLPFDRLRVNQCGYFAAEGIPAPSLGFLAIGIDDADAVDDHALAGVALPATGGLRIQNQNVYVARWSTVQMWTDSADMPFGLQTFADRGVYVPIFQHCGQPVSGVTVLSGGSPQPTNDYYFSDADPLIRTTVDVNRTDTGANGTALLVDAELVQHTGSGGEIGACEWDSQLADAIPGVVFAQEVHSVDPDTGEICTCP